MFGVKPFRLKAVTESEDLVTKAGNNYLFKVGELIGPQIEMYQEKERVLPVENDFGRVYKRQIKVHMPDGYVISNPDAVNIHHFYEKDGEKIMEFHSYYTMENNILTVFADEYYKIVKIAPELYEDYRKVINSAAEFNKINLIFKPLE